MLNFIQTLVNFFDVSPAGGRIALLQYSTNANVVLKFNTLTGRLLDGAEVVRKVGRLQCQEGLRRIDKALELADKEILTSAGGMRNISRVNTLTTAMFFPTPKYSFPLLSRIRAINLNVHTISYTCSSCTNDSL